MDSCRWKLLRLVPLVEDTRIDEESIYETCLQNKVSNFFHLEYTFIVNECYIDERLDFQLFFDVITVAIDALLHALWNFSYTLVIELSCHIVQFQGSIRVVHELSHADFQAPLLQLFRQKLKAYQKAVCTRTL